MASQATSITITSEILNDDQTYRIISTRKEKPGFRTLRIECLTDLHDTQRLINVIIKLAPEIENFHWDFCYSKIDEKDFDAIMKKLNNVKEISVHNLRMMKSNDESSETVLNLPNLRSLSSYCVDLIAHEAILKIGSKNLRRLTIFSKNSNCTLNINRFFWRNRNLLKVSLYGSFKNLYALRHLTQLQQLYIEDCLIESKSFLAICRLRNLIFLDVSITKVSSCVFSNMSRMSCLKSLVLRSREDYDSTDHFIALSMVAIPNLQSMQLKIGNVAITEETLMRFRINYPDLKTLEMSFTENRNVCDFIEHLKQLESLTVNFSLLENSSNSLSSYFTGMVDQVKDSNLKVLAFHFHNFGDMLSKDSDKALLKIITNLPKLESLDIQGINFNFETEFLENILNVWEGIEELDLTFASNECRDYKTEFETFSRLTRLLNSYNIQFKIPLQCPTHYSRIKNNFANLQSFDNVTTITDDPNYFKGQLERGGSDENA